jgi:hypothetical protein
MVIKAVCKHCNIVFGHNLNLHFQWSIAWYSKEHKEHNILESVLDVDNCSYIGVVMLIYVVQ